MFEGDCGFRGRSLVGKSGRFRWLWWLAAGLTAFAVAAALVYWAALHAEPYLRARVVAELSDHFHARVELDAFHISLRDEFQAEGQGLRIWPPAQMQGVAVPAGAGRPLIQLDRFRFCAPLRFSSGGPIHIALVQLEGLQIDLPPRSHFAPEPSTGPRPTSAPRFRFLADRVETNGARLTIETSKPGKLPQQYEITHLVLTGLTGDGPLTYQAELKIPRPRGTVQTQGHFGPWESSDPGESPLDGEYKLEKADLSVFHGIAGILDSTGRFQGTLRDLAVEGSTASSDFSLTHFGQSMPLKTSFKAQVDGTNGDTVLNSVDATLGNSRFTTRGSILRLPGPVSGGVQQPPGHNIHLDVDVDRARIEDFLKLTSKSGKLLLTGDVQMRSTLDIPPGPDPVHLRLKLKGGFTLDRAFFASSKIQSSIAQLSLRGQGRPDAIKETDAQTIASSMEGEFQLAAGLLHLPRVDFSVPGASIHLAGSYGIEGGTLDFDGKARLQAPVSRLVGGWGAKLLKPLDPLLKRDGAGTQLPVHIQGTREDPKFGVDFNKIL